VFKALAIALFTFAFGLACVLAGKKMTRPEKSLQFLLLILLFIYKVKVSPDMSLQFVFSWGDGFFIFFSVVAV